MSKQTKPQISKQEYVTNKVLAMFTVCLTGVMVLMGLQRMLTYGTTIMTGFYTALVLAFVGVAITIFGLVLLVRERKKGKKPYKVICGSSVTIAGILLTLCMTLVYQTATLFIGVFYVLLPALAVYYLIYHSYAAEFFVIALDCGIGAGMIWALQRILSSHNINVSLFIAILGFGAVILVLFQFIWIKKQKTVRSEAQQKRSERKPFSKNAFTMLYLTPLLMLALLAVTFALPAYWMFYLGAAVAYLFVTAVYYTVKLM